jgi:hypothetical protein
VSAAELPGALVRLREAVPRLHAIGVTGLSRDIATLLAAYTDRVAGQTTGGPAPTFRHPYDPHHFDHSPLPPEGT